MQAFASTWAASVAHPQRRHTFELSASPCRGGSILAGPPNRVATARSAHILAEQPVMLVGSK